MTVHFLKYIQEKINSLYEAISDIGNNAAVTINSAGNEKQRQLALEWWNDSINKKCAIMKIS